MWIQLELDAKSEETFRILDELYYLTELEEQNDYFVELRTGSVLVELGEMQLECSILDKYDYADFLNELVDGCYSDEEIEEIINDSITYDQDGSIDIPEGVTEHDLGDWDDFVCGPRYTIDNYVRAFGVEEVLNTIRKYGATVVVIEEVTHTKVQDKVFIKIKVNIDYDS